MEKVLKYITIFVFMAFILSFGIATVLFGNKDYSELEKRELQKAPKVKAGTILKGTFQDDFNNYLSDQFLGRDSWVTVKTAANKAILQRENQGVYFAKDNYLIEKYTDEDFDDKTINENIKYLSKFINLAASSSEELKTFVVMIPGKARALDKKLPKYATVSKKQDKMEQKLKKKIKNSDEIVIDLCETMQKHQNEYIYYRTDHHWTIKGAYYCYQEIKKRLGEETPAYSELSIKKVANSFKGTAFNKVHYCEESDVIQKAEIDTAKNCRLIYDKSGELSESDTLYCDEYLKESDKYLYYLGGNFGTIKIHTGCTNGKTLVLIKDSYSNCLVPYLTQDYENIVMVDLRYVNSSIFDILQELEQIDALMVVYNEEKFMQDGHQYYLQ